MEEGSVLSSWSGDGVGLVRGAEPTYMETRQTLGSPNKHGSGTEKSVQKATESQPWVLFEWKILKFARRNCHILGVKQTQVGETGQKFRHIQQEQHKSQQQKWDGHACSETWRKM